MLLAFFRGEGTRQAVERERLRVEAKADSDRQRVLALQSILIAQQTAGDARVARALAAVKTIVVEQRRIQEKNTKTIVRTEVRSTVTKTATVTETPRNCRKAVVGVVCPNNGASAPAVLGLGLAMPLVAFGLIRRTRP